MTYEQAIALLRKTMVMEYATNLNQSESFRDYVAKHGFVGVDQMDPAELVKAVCESGWADHSIEIGDAVVAVEATLQPAQRISQGVWP